jgi:hypothetical protein
VGLAKPVIDGCKKTGVRLTEAELVTIMLAFPSTTIPDEGCAFLQVNRFN